MLSNAALGVNPIADDAASNVDAVAKPSDPVATKLTFPQVDDGFICPISSMIMRGGVVLASDGHSYQEEYIERVLETDRPKSPKSRAPLKPDVYPNHDLRDKINTFLSANPQFFNLDEDKEDTSRTRPDVYLPASFWTRLFAAIEKNQLSDFNTLIQLDPRLLLLTPQTSVEKGYTYPPRDKTTQEQIILPNITALQFAIKHNAVAIVNRIRELSGQPAIKHADEVSSEYPQMLLNADLMLAVSVGNLSAVQEAHARGADLNAFGAPYESSALHVAVQKQSIAISEFLLANGAVITTDSSGRTPVHLAALNDDDAILKLLFSHHAELEIQDKVGNAPLHWAARCGATRAARFLLSKKVNFEIRNAKGETPLLLACRGEKNENPAASPFEVLRQLAYAGADVHARNDRGETGLHYSHSTAITRQLLTRGVGVDVADCHGHTPLYQALSPHSTASIDKIRLLLEYGADPDGSDQYNNQRTPLCNILNEHKPDEALLLLQYGACPYVLSDAPLQNLFPFILGKGRDARVHEALMRAGLTTISAGCDNADALCQDTLQALRPIAERVGVTLRIIPWEEALRQAPLQFAEHRRRRLAPSPEASISPVAPPDVPVAAPAPASAAVISVIAEPPAPVAIVPDAESLIAAPVGAMEEVIDDPVLEISSPLGLWTFFLDNLVDQFNRLKENGFVVASFNISTFMCTPPMISLAVIGAFIGSNIFLAIGLIPLGGIALVIGATALYMLGHALAATIKEVYQYNKQKNNPTIALINYLPPTIVIEEQSAPIIPSSTSFLFNNLRIHDSVLERVAASGLLNAEANRFPLPRLNAVSDLDPEIYFGWRRHRNRRNSESNASPAFHSSELESVMRDPTSSHFSPSSSFT